MIAGSGTIKMKGDSLDPAEACELQTEIPVREGKTDTN